MKDPIAEIESIISAGFDLVNSIKNANWSYNSKVGLNQPTLHMKEACRTWDYFANKLHKNLTSPPPKDSKGN